MYRGVSWALGISMGFIGGLIVRDNYEYTYSQKIESMRKDYIEMRTSIQQRIAAETQTVKSMKKEYRQFEAQYLALKEEKFKQEEIEENKKQLAQEKINKSQNLTKNKK